MEKYIDYYPYGMVTPGRSYNTTEYRFSFNGKEKMPEITGSNSHLDFGDRMLDVRTGRWNKCDKKQEKYPGWSPYHFGYNNPIITIDPNGEENVVVVGNQGGSPDSDAGYENKRHFLEAGLNEAIRLKNDKTLNNEITTMVVFEGEYTQEERDTYLKLATDNGIEFKVMKSVKDISKYVNTKNGEGDSRSNDLITDFTYVGHGLNNMLDIAHGFGDYPRAIAVQNIDQLLSKDAFHISATITLNSCMGGNNNYGQSISSAFSKYAGTGGVNATPNFMNWGPNELTGEGGLGSFWTHLPSVWSNQNLWNNTKGTGGNQGMVGGKWDGSPLPEMDTGPDLKSHTR